MKYLWLFSQILIGVVDLVASSPVLATSTLNGFAMGVTDRSNLCHFLQVAGTREYQNYLWNIVKYILIFDILQVVISDFAIDVDWV